MKIVETFPFSEAYETELMLLKFILSDNCISEWIICENAYSFQGDYKGYIVQTIIDTDSRFDPYRDRIKVITGNKQFSIIDKNQVQDQLAFECEYWQRDLAYKYFIQNYSNEDWLLIHDVDEMIDFTSTERKSEFYQKISTAVNGVFVVPRLRYWYDFDNKYEILYGSPLCKKEVIPNVAGRSLASVRKTVSAMPLTGWVHIIAFEYSSCFDIGFILRKLDTNSHTGMNAEDLKQSLRCNHRTIRKKLLKEKLRPNSYYFLEQVLLDEKNSPLYVRENLLRFKTNNISIDYERNRRKDYPQFYSFSAKWRLKLSDDFALAKKHLRKKVKFLFRKLKIKVTVYG